jgi:hypothetical protein
MKLLFESWRNFLKEFKFPESEEFNILTVLDVYETLENILKQAKEGYESLLKIVEKVYSQVDEARRLPKPTSEKKLINLIQTAQKADWHMWYNNNYEAVKAIFSGLGIEDEDLLQDFLRVLAATSQATRPSGNLTLAIKALRNIYIDKYTTSEEFYKTEDPKRKGEYLPDTAKNLARIARGEELTGPKISAYAKALAGEEEAVAVDRHIFDIMFGSTSAGKTKRRIATEQIIKVAKQLGLQPRQVQAALWAANQIRQGKTPQNYIEYIQVRIEEINSLLEEIKGIKNTPI